MNYPLLSLSLSLKAAEAAYKRDQKGLPHYSSYLKKALAEEEKKTKKSKGTKGGVSVGGATSSATV